MELGQKARRDLDQRVGEERGGALNNLALEKGSCLFLFSLIHDTLPIRPTRNAVTDFAFREEPQ